MVESNNDEERLARIEQMLEALQRESDARKLMVASRAERHTTTVKRRPLVVWRRVKHRHRLTAA